MKRTLLALGVAAAILAGCNNSSNSLPYSPTTTPTPFPTGLITPTPSPTPTASSTPTASPTPTATPTATPTVAPTLGPVVVQGITFTQLGQTAIYTATQSGAPAGTYFTASGNAACSGVATIVGTPPAASPAPQPPAVAATANFTVGALLNSTACVITFTSSANSATINVPINISSGFATASPTVQ